MKTCCDPSTDPRATGYLWICPHGLYWLCYGEGQNAWVAIDAHQYKAILRGQDSREVMRKKAS